MQAQALLLPTLTDSLLKCTHTYGTMRTSCFQPAPISTCSLLCSVGPAFHEFTTSANVGSQQGFERPAPLHISLFLS